MLLPLEHKGDMEVLMNKLNVLQKQYPLYNNFIKVYFTQLKLKYFKNESFNYNKFPRDIRSNCI